MKLSLACCTVDLDAHAVDTDGVRSRLTGTQVGLLRYLAHHPNQVVPREELYREVWGHQAELRTRSLDIAIVRLRKKVEKDPRNPDHIITIYGSGYTFVPTGQEAEAPLVPRATAAASSTRHTTNIAPDANSFYGREEESHTVTRLAREGAVCITVLGPPGTGKTRFAVHWVRDQLESGAIQSAWCCDLSETRTGADVLQVVAEALDIPLMEKGQGPTELTHRIGRVLAVRGDTLLLLDNAEQVRDEVARIVDTWWKLAPEVRFLVTSQAPLRLAIEQRMPLSPLPVPSDPSHSDFEEHPAVALFLDRARAYEPSFSLSREQRPEMLAILEALDGLPLALELAAARVRTMSLQDLRGRLTDRFRLLTRPALPALARQATLRGALDWSWSLLEPWEQSVLAQCSVFRGGMDWEALETVVSLEARPRGPWVVDVVANLVEISLLQVREDPLGGSRLGLLLTIQEYAADRLAEQGPEGVKAAHRRHARYYAEWGTSERLDRFSRQGGVALRKRLHIDKENVAVAAQRSVAANWIDEAVATTLATLTDLELHGPLDAVEAFAQPVLSLSLPPIDRVRLWTQSGLLNWRYGHQELALEQCNQAVELAHTLGEDLLKGVALCRQAAVLQGLGRTEEARASYTQALSLLRDTGCRLYEGIALSNLGAHHANTASIQEAFVCLERALVLHREVGNRLYEGVTLLNLGIQFHARGLHDDAHHHLRQALALHREVGNRPMEAVTLGTPNSTVPSPLTADDSPPP